MKWPIKLWMFAISTSMLLSVAAAAQTATPPAPNAPSSAFKTPVEKRSYALGLDIGRQMKKESLEINPTLFTQGLKDALSGNHALLSDEELRATIVDLQTELRPGRPRSTRNRRRRTSRRVKHS